MQTQSRTSRPANVALWSVQTLLALLFLFAGGMKLIMPIDALQGPIGLPEWFIRFIGVAEFLGGVGIILPGVLHVREELTSLAAVGIVGVMTGATALTVLTAQPGAFIPASVGILAVVVAFGRN